MSKKVLELDPLFSSSLVFITSPLLVILNGEEIFQGFKGKIEEEIQEVIQLSKYRLDCVGS